MFFTFTLSGFLITLLMMYIGAMLLIGKIPYLPIIYDIIKMNFGE